MNQADYVAILRQNLIFLNQSNDWLKRSFKICSDVGIKESYTKEEFDAFETLTSRFARVSDIIIQKVFRSLDMVEFENVGGTLLDSVHRAEKRGIVEDTDQVRAMRELRNEIAHEYVQDALTDIFLKVLDQTPVLFKIIERVNEYGGKYGE